MRTVVGLLLSLLLLAMLPGAPRAGDADEPPMRIFQAQGLRFESNAERLVILVEQDLASDASIRTVIERDGRLFVEGQRVETDRRDRKLLRRFLVETSRMSESIDSISRDVAAQLRPDLDANEAREISIRIRRVSERMDEQSAKLAAVATELVARIPALVVLERFIEE